MLNGACIFVLLIANEFVKTQTGYVYMNAGILLVIRKICGTKQLSENLAKESESLKSELKELKEAFGTEFKALISEMCSCRDDLFFNMCSLHSGKQQFFLKVNGEKKVIPLYHRGGAEFLSSEK